MIDWLSGVTVKVWLTGAAAEYVLLPDCIACTVHAPPPTIVTVFPETVQTDNVVEELKRTGSPEVAFALTVKGAVPYT